jgi:hypothetical protein
MLPRWSGRSRRPGTWWWTWPISRPPIRSRPTCAGSGSAAVRCMCACWAPGTAPGPGRAGDLLHRAGVRHRHEEGLDRLVFLLDIRAADVGIPVSSLIDAEFGARQEAFRRRVQECGLVTQQFAEPFTLGALVERSLRELAEQHRRRDSGTDKRTQVPAVVVAGEIPQEPLGYQPRPDLLAALGEPGWGLRVVHALTGMRGGKTPWPRRTPGPSWRRAGGWWRGLTPRTPGWAAGGPGRGRGSAGPGRGRCAGGGPGGAPPAGSRPGPVPAGVR